MDVLPNSLTKQPKVDATMSVNGMEWLFLYCASCGKDGGRVLKTDVPNREEFAFYLCEACNNKYGELAGTTAIPDELFFAKVREAQLEREGRELRTHEIVEALQDSGHYLSQLIRDRNTFLASE